MVLVPTTVLSCSWNGVEVFLLPAKKRRKLTTHVQHKTLNPRWNEVFVFEGEL